MENKRIFWILATVAGLLFIPLVAMQFSDDVDWDVTDFIVAGVLLGGAGLICELILRKIKRTNHRVALCLAVLVLLVLVWAELAVGVFGTPLAGS